MSQGEGTGYESYLTHLHNFSRAGNLPKEPEASVSLWTGGCVRISIMHLVEVDKLLSLRHLYFLLSVSCSQEFHTSTLKKRSDGGTLHRLTLVPLIPLQDHRFCSPSFFFCATVNIIHFYTEVPGNLFCNKS